MLDYKFLSKPGALSEASAADAAAPADLAAARIPAAVLQLIPAAVAHENLVLPLDFDGETITCAAADADSIALADKLRFLLAKNIRLIAAPREAILEAIHRHYPRAVSIDLESLPANWQAPAASARPRGGGWLRLPELGRYLGKGITEFKKGTKGLNEENGEARPDGPSSGGQGMFFYVVPEGQRVLRTRRDGTMDVVVGPKRVWRGRSTLQPMAHHVAHPGKFLILHYRDGRQEHLPGPAEVWFDPRAHAQIGVADALQLSAKEAIVVYSSQSGTVTRRIVHGPALFVPAPGEWLHTFSWHASRGGSRGVAKEPNALVFQKLWLMPDQMYHDVADVRTNDDAVLTVRLMIFFELTDIERMLEATHDPIGDFVNAATSDAVAFTARHDFEQFKRNTGQLNDMETYRQLTGRAAQCGYRINKVVYRGYVAADSLQLMHNQAIEARTRLQLDRATEQQAQDLENYKLDCQLARASKRRTEQVAEVEHDLGLARKRQEEDARRRDAEQTQGREGRRLEAEQQLAIRRGLDAQQRDHLAALRDLSVDLTAFLTQARADQVIELRGGGRPHVHLDKAGRENHASQKE